MSKMSLNHKEITFKGGEINNYAIQTIHFGIMEEKVIVFIYGDLFLGQIYESSGTERNVGRQAEVC